jgi:septal ring factor EnvC (AmiA/AmiB activator)
MSEDKTTSDLTDRKILNLIISRPGAVEDRLAALEAAETERRDETRPKLDKIHAYVDQLSQDMVEVKTIVKRLDSDVTRFSRELIGIKAGQDELERRVADLERKPS